MSEENHEIESDELDDKELLAQIKARFVSAQDAEINVRRDALDDLRFRAGEQWPDDIKKERSVDGRPCLVINKMPQFIRQITNEQRQNRPAIKISPVDDKADVETAKIFQGVIKHIENSSNASVAYDNAFMGATVGGFGYIRVITDYCDEMSFDQEIQIKQVFDPNSVYFDPSSREPDGSDATFAFVHDEMSKKEFKAEYPNAKACQMSDYTSVGDSDGWMSKDSVRVAEYFYKDFKKVNLVQVRDAEGNIQVFDEKELPTDHPFEVLAERESLVPTIKWVKTNGYEILEKTTWPGKWIPIIPVYGEVLVVDGKKIYESVIRHAKDSQRMYNYWASTETETIALAPKAPFIAAEGQIPEAYENIWKSANRKNLAYLPYKPVSIQGQLVGAPQRNAYEAPIAAITSARMQSSDDIKATTGIYDASLGSKSNETSGVAIQRRNSQAQTSNYHFIDNLNRSIRHAGKILVDLIPKIYDTARVLRTIGEDGQESVVTVNALFEKDGKPVKYDLGVGKYDVIVETGPSFATKRQEAASSMIDMTKAFPQLAQIAGDIIVGNMDWPGASDIQKRIRKTLAPNLLEDKGEKEIPPEIQAQMGQMQQQMQMMSQQLQEADEALRTKKIELESKERIEFAKLDTQLAIAQANNESKEALAGFQSALSSMADEQALIKQRLSLLSYNEPIIYEPGGYPAADQQQNTPTGGPQSLGQNNGEYP